ncbi:MAG: PilZ domain-containing protein [Rhodospirillaceae bacterium]|jgi:hypothetical protein|nr:PilZ domain-containing protein [Rhodospirillaceae bacterium]MBT5374469.1 PilZ domain-containing protein [Rhodospirillaceae bacterium]MBT5659958.1 PilZ domain-containing protein [Rhodospirillaceae bacterium]MBT5751268.1 PilZ domain-containing protein [Rhodospirillaceae bacterium]
MAKSNETEQKGQHQDDGRRHSRFDLFGTATATIEGKKHKCAILNLSISGAAIVFDIDFGSSPKPGTRVDLDIEGIGAFNGYVARDLDEGIAVHLNVSEKKRDVLAAVIMRALNNIEPEDE